MIIIDILRTCINIKDLKSFGKAATTINKIQKYLIIRRLV